jgi:hypothetical protein
MKIVFNNYASEYELIKMIDKWSTQYSVENYTVITAEYDLTVEFSAAEHITIFALTWDEFISDVKSFYRYQLERYKIMQYNNV